LHVFATVQIQAEIRRVLYALSTPEYMEAWLQLPETERIECYPDQGSFDRFRIDLFACGNRRGCIYGSCLLSKPDKITYLWERDPSEGRPKSIVEVRLWGGNGCCTLKLEHGIFRSQAEAQWHSAMWNNSLRKLCRITEGIGIAR
jgi:hypothetical protein